MYVKFLSCCASTEQWTPNQSHPLRQCVKRLKAKADRLLRHVTDRRERTDPSIPYELGAEYTGLLPKMNGVSPTHTRSSSHSSAKGGTPGMAAIRPSPSLYRQPTFNLNIPFPESAAITRTPEGMAMFFELDAEVAAAFKKPNMQLMQRLKRIAPPSLLNNGGQDGVDAVIPKEENLAEADEVTGDKRKLCVISYKHLYDDDSSFLLDHHLTSRIVDPGSGRDS